MNTIEHERQAPRNGISSATRPALWGGGVIVLFLAFLTIWGFMAPVSGAAVVQRCKEIRPRHPNQNDALAPA